MPKKIIVITRKRTIIYPSITAAADALGVDKMRIVRALNSYEGEVSGLRPKVYVDEALLPPGDLSESEKSDFKKNKKEG